MGFMFYDSYREAASALPAELQGEFYRLLVEYACAGVEPECDGVLRLGFELARPNLDKSVARSKAGAKGGSSTSDAKRSAVRANGAKGGRPAETPQEPKQKPKQNQSKTKAKPKQKPKQGEERGGEVRGRTPMGRPTIEEVREHVRQKGYSFDADAFYAYYDSQGWKKANGQKVANWKQCCVTWERNRKGGVDDGFKFYDRAGEMQPLWSTLDA